MYTFVFAYDTSAIDKNIITNTFSTNQNIWISKIIFCFIFLVFLTLMLINFYLYKDDSSITNLLYKIFVVFFVLYLVFLCELGDFFNKTAVERYTDYISSYVKTTENVSKFISSPNALIDSIYDNIAQPINQLSNTLMTLQKINQNNVNTNNILQNCNTLINSVTSQQSITSTIIYQNYYLSLTLNTFNALQSIIANNLDQYNYIMNNINKTTSYISNNNNSIALNNNNLHLYYNTFDKYLFNYTNKLMSYKMCENYIDSMINYIFEPVYNQEKQAFQLSENLLLTSKNNQLYYVYIGYDIGFNIDINLDISYAPNTAYSQSLPQNLPLKSLNDAINNKTANILINKQLANNDTADLFCCYDNNAVFIYYNEVFLLLVTTSLGTYIMKGYKDTTNKIYVLDSIEGPCGNIFQIIPNSTNLFNAVTCINKFINKDNLQQLNFTLNNQQDTFNSNTLLPITLFNNLFQINMINTNSSTKNNINFYGNLNTFKYNITTITYSINNYPEFNNSIFVINFVGYPIKIIVNNTNSINKVNYVNC